MTAPPGSEPLSITSSEMTHLWDGLCAAYRILGFELAAKSDKVFRDLVLARIIEPNSTACRPGTDQWVLFGVSTLYSKERRARAADRPGSGDQRVQGCPSPHQFLPPRGNAALTAFISTRFIVAAPDTAVDPPADRLGGSSCSASPSAIRPGRRTAL